MLWGCCSYSSSNSGFTFDISEKSDEAQTGIWFFNFHFDNYIFNEYLDHILMVASVQMQFKAGAHIQTQT